MTIGKTRFHVFSAEKLVFKYLEHILTELVEARVGLTSFEHVQKWAGTIRDKPFCYLGVGFLLGTCYFFSLFAQQVIFSKVNWNN